MSKYPLVGGSILAVVLIVLVSLTNVVGYHAVQASNQEIINSEVSQKDVLFQTIINPYSTNQHFSTRTTGGNNGYVIFSQRPYLPSESWIFRTSSALSNPVYLCQDNFFTLVNFTTGIQFYGICAMYSGGWIQGDPTGFKFQIIFYDDNTGVPGNVKYTFSDLEPTAIDTGVSYSWFEMYYWTVDFPPPFIAMTSGWVSIQNTYHPDNFWFLWAGSPEGDQSMYQQGESVPHIVGDSAFNLTSFGSFPPDITIEGILQPVSGPAAVIAPIINITGEGGPIAFPLTVQITSSALEYNKTQNVDFYPWPHPYIWVVFPDWTPVAWDNPIIVNTTIEYTIIATAYCHHDQHQEDNTKTQTFNLTYTRNLHRLFFFGLILNKTEDNISISFRAKSLFYYDRTTSDHNVLSSFEKIFLSKEHKVGYVGAKFIIGMFDGFMAFWG